MPRFSDEEINKILISNPPIYASGKYYVEMSKKCKVTQKYIKEKCIKLGLIKTYK